MLWPTLAWTTGLAGGVGSAFAISTLPWRYAPPMGVWLTGLWLNNISSGLTKRVGEGAIWGGSGSFAGLVGYDLWKQGQYWFGTEIAAPKPPSPPEPNTQQEPAAPPDTPQKTSEPIDPEITNLPDSNPRYGPRPTMGGVFMNPPRVSQGVYPSRSKWWSN